ncbi:protein D7-like isoform X2 [Emys orbicularis]|uniref:protein D7-like isoform X2 n=1 Tax=Emys orbicularis TaxID=82168 RepID=UPI0031FCE5D8
MEASLEGAGGGRLPLPGAVDALDPEKLIQCPYDKSHQIRACRFPYHLIKCRKNHPDIAKELATCPFNARHLVPRDEISHHISSCDDKSCIEQDIVSQSNNCYREKMNTVSMWQPPPCDEDWDKEIQEQSNSTFVWGTFNSGINNSPGSSVVMEPKNNLMPGMRAPKSLPYSLSWKSRTSMTFSPKKELKETPRSWQCPPCQEDWEADADESGATSPFVLGSKTNHTLSTSQSLGERGRDGNQQMQAVSTSAAAWTPKGHSWRNVDALDPEKLIQCPYDKSHQIRACRFPYHLIKCRKNHPDIAKQLATCPFNARHLVPRDEISHHISSCDDKSCIEQDIEIQEQSNSTFVWGTFNSGINNSPGSSVVMEPKNNLMPGMRAPKSLPYSLSW